MEYFTFKRFKGDGITGYFNLPYGTIVTETGGFLHGPDGRSICAAKSEMGWGHFRPNTPEGAYRQTMIDRLYRYYERGRGNVLEDFAPEKWAGAENDYWKSLIRTMPTDKLTAFYRERLGEPPLEEV